MSKWLIVGSVAIRHWFPDFTREPGDLDVLTPAKLSTTSAEDCIIESHWHDAAEFLISRNRDKVFADPNVLYTMKVSHAHWNIWWSKTLYDIEWLRRKNCTLDEELYHKLLEVWNVVHGKKKVYLKVSNEEFFDDAVPRVHDHDHLHEVVAFGARPMHERIRPSLDSAWCSKELFEKLTEFEQYDTALEEIMVTAIERSSLTSESTMVTRRVAMGKAHKQLVTSMTAGWFARFLIEHRYRLLEGHYPYWKEYLSRALKRLDEEHV